MNSDDQLVVLDGSTLFVSRKTPDEEASAMTGEELTTTRLWLHCRRCQRTWQATYQVRTFHDDAGDHELYYRGGAPAAAPQAARCPHCGGLRVTIVPGPPPFRRADR